MRKAVERRVLGAVASAGLTLAVLTGAAQAQVASPPTMAQRAPMTMAQLAVIMETAIPMENLADTNPLQAAGGGATGTTPAVRSSGSGGSLGAAPTAGEPQVTSGRRGRIERVGARFTDMYGSQDQGGAAAGSSTVPQGAETGAQNYGQGNLNTIYHYNDYQQLPVPIYYAPQRQAGYYLFQASNGLWYHCTAALISNAILITAGHCVHDGNGTQAGWNQDGYFFPGYTNKYSQAEQRYGACRTSYYVTTSGWYANGDIHQGNDVAMAVCGQLTGGAWGYSQNRLPGTVLGYFGFCYANCLQNYHFLTQLGYPGNYHNGLQMTVSQHLSESMTNGVDYLYGTGMRGGSSGGPHIQNIGNLWDLATDRGQRTQRNVIFAVTSWGYVSESFKLQGAASISGPANANNAVSLFNLACAESRALHGNWTCTNL